MKIGILTHYNVSSHGALLQMYALKTVLEDLGHTVCILTYSRNLDLIDTEKKKRFSASIFNLPYYLSKYMGDDGVVSLIYQYKKQKVLKSFRQSNFTLVPYTCSGELDCVIVGADEVFALENGINFMMFGHGITARRIIAYAPSFGQTDVERIERYGFQELIDSGLKRFSALSARDQGTKEIIEHFLKREIPMVCDPALLYSFNHPHKKNTKTKYIVVYSYQSNFKDKNRIRIIREYAKKNHFELWSVGVYFKWCNRHINCDPLKMINIFADAQAVITDTFHGTITSYIAHTPMAVYVRQNNNVKLEYLLEQIGISKRRVEKEEDLSRILSMPMDFNRLDNNVSVIREASIEYLKNSIL